MKKSKVFYIVVLVLSLLLLSGCQKKIEKPLILGANLWIGYAPLYYAYEKGWLRKNDIKFVSTISLGQTIKYYRKGSFDVFAGTNYEYVQAKKVVKDLVAIKLLDISKGGDLIYANRDIDKLKKADKIDILLEKDSINSMLFEKFSKKYGLKKEQLNLVNYREDAALHLKMKENPTIVVIYKPYDMYLEKIGYKMIATAKSLNFTIFDALFVSKRYMQNHEDKIQDIKIIFDNALKDLQHNPLVFYNTVNSYFNYKNYTQFTDALKSISWKSSEDLSSLITGANR